MAKKTWLNSKEPPPQWIAWCLIILVWFGIMLIVTGMDLEDAIVVSSFIFLIIAILYCYFHFFKNTNKIIQKVGIKRYNDINERLVLINIIEAELLGISEGKFSRGHLTPPHTNFTGKKEEFWDQHKKKIRYELNYKNGQEHGLWKGWYENGQIGYQQEYKLGGFLKLGVKHGKAEVWDKSGKLLTSLMYNSGKLIYTKKDTL